MAILPGRPYRPRDKAAVEAGVLVAERRVLAPLRKRQFFSLAELNDAIAERVALVNDGPFRGQTISRRQLFEELERAALQPLPATPYEFARWKLAATVNIDYHIEFDARFYSVPHRLVREHVDVRATATTVEIFHRGRRVTSHAREYGKRRFLTRPEHMPASHRAHLEWTPSKLIAWGRSVGPAVGELVEMILNTRPHPEHGYRACMGLKRLFKRYGADRLAAACQRALATGGISYTSVDAILKNGLDRSPALVEAAPKIITPVRGRGPVGSGDATSQTVRRSVWSGGVDREVRDRGRRRYDESTQPVAP
jgi:transposase